MNTDRFARSPSVLHPENYSYQKREYTAPPVEEDEEIIFDEPGRILPPTTEQGNATDCRSHYFRVTKAKFGKYRLRVKHGGGEECWDLDYSDRTAYGLMQMDSDSRFRILWIIMDAHHEGEGRGAKKYCQLFLEGRLKKRRKNGLVSVEILPQAEGE